jgi:hypothetical protein
MAKRGHEINLASGVMFSPAQENVRMQKMRVRLAIDLTLQFMPTKGVSVEYFKRPGQVHEFQFEDGDGRAARRSLDNDMIKKGGRKASCEMMESVCEDYGIPFSWEEVPDQAEPVRRVIVDVVGGPPENADRIPHEPSDPPAPPVVVVPEPVPTDQQWNQDWTIAQLKEWSRANGHPVPSDLKRKGDIIEFIAREHSN